MDRESFRAFVRRDRASVEALKRAHHARRYREAGAARRYAARPSTTTGIPSAGASVTLRLTTRTW
jgi:hypothetical protein